MNREPSMNPKMRRVVLRYADWWADPTAPSWAVPARPDDLSTWLWDGHCGIPGAAKRDVLYSLAYDGTRGPAIRKGMKR